MKKGFGGGMQQLMKQANQMQNKMKKVQEELALKEFEGTAGGGAVKVMVNGKNEVKAVTIQPDAVSPCLLYTSPSPRDQRGSRMPSSA